MQRTNGILSPEVPARALPCPRRNDRPCRTTGKSRSSLQRHNLGPCKTTPPSSAKARREWNQEQHNFTCTAIMIRTHERETKLFMPLKNVSAPQRSRATLSHDELHQACGGNLNKVNKRRAEDLKTHKTTSSNSYNSYVRTGTVPCGKLNRCCDGVGTIFFIFGVFGARPTAVRRGKALRASPQNLKIKNQEVG